VANGGYRAVAPEFLPVIEKGRQGGKSGDGFSRSLEWYLDERSDLLTEENAMTFCIEVDFHPDQQTLLLV